MYTPCDSGAASFCSASRQLSSGRPPLAGETGWQPGSPVLHPGTPQLPTCLVALIPLLLLPSACWKLKTRKLDVTQLQGRILWRSSPSPSWLFSQRLRVIGNRLLRHFPTGHIELYYTAMMANIPGLRLQLADGLEQADAYRPILLSQYYGHGPFLA